MNRPISHLPSPISGGAGANPPISGGAAAIQPHITPVGLALLWCSAGFVGIGAFRFDGPLLLLGLLGLAAIGLARFWAPRNLRGIRVSRELPSHVFAGDPFEISFTLATDHGRWLDAFSIGIRDELLPKGPRHWLWAGRIPGNGGVTSGRIRARLFRRGIERRRRLELKSTFPLGLFEVREERILELSESDTNGLIVYPRPLLPEALRRELDLARFEIANPHGLEPEPSGEFRGVRAWRPGDSLRAIHWPATARVGSMVATTDSASFSTLMVREWDPPGPRPQRFGILFHSLSPAGNLIRPDRFELALRIAAGLLLYCRDAGIPVRFNSPFPSLSKDGAGVLRMPDRAGFNEGLTRLALAKRVPCREPNEIAAAIGGFPDCERIFVISDSPADAWKNATGGGGSRPVVCVDSESIRIERPALRLKLKPGRSR